MIRVAIVEDEPECQDLLAGCLGRYGKENGEEFSVERFSDGAELADFYKPVWDIVFLDIEMERLDGMNAARIIRKSDECVAIIFVTRLANYAVQGFDVNALDFIVKPFSYRNFALKMNKAVRYVRKTRGKTVQLKTADAVYSIPVSDILYVEAQGHDIIYHTYDREYHTWHTLKMATDLLGGGFALCNRCYLVNLRHVRSVEGDTVNVAGHELQISRYRKKPFMDALAGYVSAE